MNMLTQNWQITRQKSVQSTNWRNDSFFVICITTGNNNASHFNRTQNFQCMFEHWYWSLMVVGSPLPKLLVGWSMCEGNGLTRECSDVLAALLIENGARCEFSFRQKSVDQIVKSQRSWDAIIECQLSLNFYFKIVLYIAKTIVYKVFLKTLTSNAENSHLS